MTETALLLIKFSNQPCNIPLTLKNRPLTPRTERALFSVILFECRRNKKQRGFYEEQKNDKGNLLLVHIDCITSAENCDIKNNMKGRKTMIICSILTATVVITVCSIIHTPGDRGYGADAPVKISVN